MTVTVDEGELRRLSHQLSETRVNVELETEGMTLNLGPQHPATHGTLRIVAKLDGEQVVAAEPVCGYMHRGKEKLTEVRTWPQINTLVNRIDWVGSFANEVPFILAAEQLGPVVVLLQLHQPTRGEGVNRLLGLCGGRLVLTA